MISYLVSLELWLTVQSGHWRGPESNSTNIVSWLFLYSSIFWNLTWNQRSSKLQF